MQIDPNASPAVASPTSNDDAPSKPRGLTAGEILDAPDARLEPVDVSEWWGGIVYVRSITGTERDHYEQSLMAMRGNKLVPKLDQARTKLVALTLCDEHGQRLFTTETIRKLGEKNAKPIDLVYDKAQELSGLMARDVEELVGNSDADQSGDSSID